MSISSKELIYEAKCLICGKRNQLNRHIKYGYCVNCWRFLSSDEKDKIIRLRLMGIKK